MCFDPDYNKRVDEKRADDEETDKNVTRNVRPVETPATDRDLVAA